MEKVLEYTVVANFEGEQLEMFTYTVLEKALESKEETEVENDTQCFIRVYEVEKQQDAKDARWATNKYLSKTLVEII